MNQSEMLAHSSYVFAKDYFRILGTEASSVYYYLLSAENKILYKKFDKDTLALSLGITKERLEGCLSILVESELMTRPYGKDGKFSFNMKPITQLSNVTKLELISKLFNKNLLDAQKKDELEILFAKKEEVVVEKEDVNEKNKANPVKSINITTTQTVNPDSYKGLAYYYYKLISERRGYKIISTNYLKEMHLIKVVSEANGDTPEQIRQMFQWIINNNKFDYICTLDMYPILRKRAYDKLFGLNHQFASPINSDSSDNDPQFIRTIYEYFVEKGEAKDIIAKKYLYPNHDKSAVDAFLKTLE